MKTIRAYSCVRTGHNGSGHMSNSVCILLDETHARHTLRTFLRGQGDNAVLEAVPDAQVLQLVGAAGVQAAEDSAAR